MPSRLGSSSLRNSLQTSFLVITMALLGAAAPGCGADGNADSLHGNDGDDGETEPPPPPPEGWTVLVYMVADNNLEPDALDDLEEMIAVGSNDDLRIVAQVDRSPSFSSDGVGGLPNWTTAKRLFVRPGQLEELADLGEVNMGASDTLASFVEWGIKTYPAAHTMLVLWDHGAGWRGFGFDETTSSSEILTVSEIQTGISKGLTRAALAKLDIIGFDACLMATYEVAATLASQGGVLVASEETEPAHGWDYRTLARLKSNPDMEAELLSSWIATDYLAQAITNDTSEGITLAAIDLGRIAEVTTALAHLKQSYGTQAQVTPIVGDILRERRQTLEFASSPNSSSGLVDLVDFFARLRATEPAVDTIAREIETAVADAVLAKVAGDLTLDARGLSIYFPLLEADYDDAYDTSVAADWRTVLKAFYGAAATAMPDFAEGSLRSQRDHESVQFSADLTAGSADLLAVAFSYYGSYEEDDSDNLTRVWYYGEDTANFSVSGSKVTMTGYWDYSILTMNDQNGYSERAFLFWESLPDLDVEVYRIPLRYLASPSATPVEAFWAFAFDTITEEAVYNSIYTVDAAGQVGELVPVAGSRLRCVIRVLTEPETNWDPEWWYSSSGAGFDPLQPFGLSWTELKGPQGYLRGDKYYLGLRIANVADRGTWAWTHGTRP